MARARGRPARRPRRPRRWLRPRQRAADLEGRKPLTRGSAGRPGDQTASGTRSSSASQTTASESLGARQSPRGESEPPEPTFGAFGTVERLNWLILKKRNRK